MHLVVCTLLNLSEGSGTNSEVLPAKFSNLTFFGFWFARATLGTNLSDQIPGGPNLTLTLTLTLIEECQVAVFVADDLGFLGPGIPDLVTELRPTQDTV